MKDQPQQPMAPMAFYPTWQTDPSQGWQNQFIQQIPQNSPAITSLNSLEFQPQSYSYQPPNGYVQTGLGFDPNYGRTYAAPVQRYEFQTQQIASPINQVSLQSVSFAPAVTYAGQVSTAPAPPPVVLSNSSAAAAAAAAQQHQLQVGAGSDLNKSMSGNDTPGYPRVSSVPPRSLNCNGYSGDFSGNQATGPQAVAQQQQQQQSSGAGSGANGSGSTTGQQQQSSNSNAQQTQQQQQSSSPMHPPSAQSSQNQQTSQQQVPQSPTRGHMQQQQQRHVSQSPNHVPQSPSSHNSSTNSSNNMQGQYPIPQSPNHNSQQMLHAPHQGMHTPNQQQSATNHISSPSHAQMSQDWNWNNQSQQQQPGGAPGEMFNQAERVNLNTRIKSMILRKNDPKDIGQGADVQMQPPTGPSANHGQSQNQTGHFLSYSHHLRGDSALNASGSSVPQQQQQQQQQQSHQQPSASAAAAAAAASAALTEPHGGGGDQIWKPQGHSFKKPPSSFQNPDQQPHHQPQHHTTSHSSKSKKNKSHSAADVEKNSNDPGGGGGGLHHHHTQQHGHHHPRGSPHHQVDIKTEKSSYPPMSGYGHHPDPNSCYPGMNPQGQYPMIKQEPGLMPPQANKMEGYERNYQNFIQYADYCQNEVQPTAGNNSSQQQQQQHQQQQQQQQQQQDYQQQHGYQNPAASYYGAGYQQHQNNYQQNFSPSYQHPPPPLPPHSSSATTASSFGCPPSSNATKSSSSSSSKSAHGHGHGVSAHNHGHSLMDLDRKHDPSGQLSMPMNYEKEIPAHAYPIPPNRYSMMQGADKTGELQPIGPGGVEEVDKITGYPFLGEGGPAAIKNIIGFSCCRQGGTRVPTIEHLKDGSCMGMQTKDEILDEEEEETDENGEPKAPGSKKKNASEDGTSEESMSAPAEVVVKRETINPMYDTTDRLEKGNKAEIPECDCFSSDKNPPEPGSYYTHLGSSATLSELRKEIEDRCGISGRQLRIEKIVYTGKEGKTTQGCPVAKWIIRRADPEEKILVVVKKRQGHKCAAAFIVVAMVAWDGMPRQEADNAYKNLIGKLNKYGLPTTRRCATNENRTCACQGLDPETSGASYSFGCSWSMYYNGCKYARSKTVRKFRLSVKNEESAIEDHMNLLATVLAPLFKQIAPRSYDNQTKYEKEAPDCRLGLKPGKPFSGVTACLDFCAHAHRDLHNMQDGCTVQVALLKPSNRDGRQPDDEQFHVLPLYTMDTTDEFESAEGQKEKHRTGAVQVLDKYPCEVRVRSTPLVPCRRHGKKRKDGEDAVEGAAAAATPQTQTTPQPPPVTPNPPPPTKKESSKSRSKSKANQQAQQQQQQQQLNPPSTPSSAPPSTPSPRCQTPVTNNPSPAGSAFSTPPVNNVHNGGNNNLMSSNSSLMNMATMIDTFTDAQLQSNQISSTVLDSPYSYDYQTGSYIDSRNYYGNWPPPPTAHPAGAPHAVAAQHPATQHPAAQHPVAQQHSVAANLTTPPNPPMTPTTPNSHHHQAPLPPAPAAVQHHDGYGNFNSHLPPVGNQLTQLQDVRGDVKSRGGSEENPDSTTIVNNLSESSKLTPLTPITNLGPPPLEEGFVKPKPPPDYQYSQYPNNYQMYPPPPPTYSPYDAYNNMNYNYGYHHQPYSPYSMYPQQTPPPTPPPPSPNWNMYPPSTSTQHPLPPHAAAAAAMHHQQAAYTPTALPPVTHTPHAHHQQTSLPPQQQQHPHHHHLQTLQSPLHHHQQQAPSQQQQQQQHQQQLQTPTAAGQSKHSQNAQQQQQQQQPQMVTPPLQQPPPVQQPPPQTDLSPPPNGAAGGATVKAEPIGEVTEINENLEAFQDPQMGGVAIALNHGSVLIECAKHEMHSTTAVKRPNRHHPTRMTLIFYQHRNLNRSRHGIDEWEEKMRVKKINTEADAKAKEEGQTKIKKEPLDEDDLDELGECSGGGGGSTTGNGNAKKEGSSKTDGHQQEAKRNKKDSNNGDGSSSGNGKAKKNSNSTTNNQEQSKNEKMVLRAPTLTTTSWTTLFPMHPCVVTGPYQEGNSSPSSTTASSQA